MVMVMLDVRCVKLAGVCVKLAGMLWVCVGGCGGVVLWVCGDDDDHARCVYICVRYTE